MKGFAAGTDPIALLEEREAILYLLPQTTPERLNKNLTGYTIDPKTRYPTLNEITPPGDVTHLFDTDDTKALSNRQPSTDKKAAKGIGNAAPLSYNFRVLLTHSRVVVGFSYLLIK